MNQTVNKAIILIGLQNDYFSDDGILKEVVEESSKVSNIIVEIKDSKLFLYDGNYEYFLEKNKKY